MKIKVSDSVKGEVIVKALGKTYKAGSVLEMTNEQFSEESTQWSIKKGILIPVGEFEKKENGGKKIKNVHKNAVSLSSLRKTVNPNESIFVSAEDLENNQIQQVLAAGWFVYDSGVSTTEIKKSVEADSVSNKRAIKNSTKAYTVLKKISSDNVQFENTGKLAKLDIRRPATTTIQTHRPDGANINEQPNTKGL